MNIVDPLNGKALRFEKGRQLVDRMNHFVGYDS